MDEDHEALGDDPAMAFEALRAEVAALRARFEDGDGAPDYAPTLGKMAATLAKIEAHPALRQTPEGYRAATNAAVGAIRSVFEAEAQKALQTIGYAAGEIRRHAGELRTRRGQTEALAVAAAGGLIAGAVLWVLLSGPAVRALPASWHIPERMAADTLHEDMWTAGGRLMQAADPQGWDRVVADDRIAHDNAPALERCGQDAVKFGEAQPCKVMVSPR